MSVETVSDSILKFTTHNTYPDDDKIVTTDLNPQLLSTILDNLRQQRDGLKEEIRVLSRTTGPDVETWIAQAKKLQADIEASRQLAREIVEEHEAGYKIKTDIQDAGSKIELLEREVQFDITLEATLCQIKNANNSLLDVQDAIVERNIEEALNRLNIAMTAVAQLDNVAETRAVVLLKSREKSFRSSLEEAVAEKWSAMILVDVMSHKVTINESLGLITSVVSISQQLGILESLVHSLGRNLERALFKPLLMLNQSNSSYTVEETSAEIRLQPDQAELTSKTLFESLSKILDFLLSHLPDQVTKVLYTKLGPALMERLEDDWLNPSLPSELSQVQTLEETIHFVRSFTKHTSTMTLGGGDKLQEWIDGVPRLWLTRRREKLLNDARNLVFQGLHETKTVERIESEMISKDDTLAAHVNGGDDDWDAWDEGDEKPSTTIKRHDDSQPSGDDDEASAWEVDEAETTEPAAEEAWGWGDEGNTNVDETLHENPPGTQKLVSTQREMTFRETYTTTAIPDGILASVQAIITDAQRLAGEEFADSVLSPAVAGLYSLPTQALAIYRATAPTAYAKLRTGNMLIYNDATRLSEQLRDWQASQPPASRLRLDNDAKALDLFAKHAYGAEMEAQRTILKDILDGAQGFANCIAPPFKQECESAIEQTADRLQDVHREWKDILSHNALLQSLGQLLSGVTGKIIADIEDLSDIGEADSRQLKLLCERLSVVRALFIQTQSEGEPRDMTFVYCPNWLKFQYLAEILESSLADIRYLWTDGELSLEFSAEEIVDLIKALFAESEHRRKLIGDLRRQSRR